MPRLRERLESVLSAEFRIERELAGGMSRVFVATECALGRQVVIKVLPPDLAAVVNVERFRREVQLAAGLQHPHVVPLLTAGERDGLLYYTMPYVEGESLRRRLTGHGALPLDDALRILREVADALAYAHSRGVVHRDVKPENVLLSGRHALVIDFGVAKAVSAATSADVSVTASGIVIGTPLYMSPEQAAGDPTVDHRADLYALGALGYELLAGRPPFSGSSAIELIAAHLTERPAPVEQLRPDVTPSVAALIARCLEKRPEDRPQSAEEVLRALDTTSVSSGTPTPRPTRAGAMAFVGRPATLVALAAAVALLGVAARLGLSSVGGSRPPTPALDPRRILVLAFANRSGDPSLDQYGSMAADWIAQGLSESGVAEVASPMGGVAARAAAGRTNTAPLELAREARAGTVITGSFYRTGDTLRIQAQIRDGSAGDVRWALEPVSAPTANPMGGITALRLRVLGAVSRQLDGRELWAQSGLSPRPPSFDAYRVYLEASEFFFRGEWSEATRLYLRAYALDSTSGIALPWAVQAQFNSDHFARADSILTVYEHAPGERGAWYRASYDYLTGVIHGDQGRALAAARAMVQRAPHSEAQLFALQEAVQANRPREAVEAGRILLQYRGWTQWWPGTWRWLTEAHHLLGDHEEELRAARRGRGEFPQLLTAAQREAVALAALGRADSALAIVRAAPMLRPGLGATPITTAHSVADELRAHGAPDSARALDRLALEWARVQPPAAAASPRGRYTLARALCRAGEAKPSLAILSGLLREHPDTIDFRGLQGVCAARAGDRGLASLTLEKLTTVSRPYAYGEHLYWAARIAALLGDRQRAVTLLQGALANGLSFGIRIHREPDFAQLRGYAPFEELLRPKG